MVLPSAPALGRVGASGGRCVRAALPQAQRTCCCCCHVCCKACCWCTNSTTAGSPPSLLGAPALLPNAPTHSTCPLHAPKATHLPRGAGEESQERLAQQDRASRLPPVRYGPSRPPPPTPAEPEDMGLGGAGSRQPPPVPWLPLDPSEQARGGRGCVVAARCACMWQGCGACLLWRLVLPPSRACAAGCCCCYSCCRCCCTRLMRAPRPRLRTQEAQNLRLWEAGVRLPTYVVPPPGARAGTMPPKVRWRAVCDTFATTTITAAFVVTVMTIIMRCPHLSAPQNQTPTGPLPQAYTDAHAAAAAGGLQGNGEGQPGPSGAGPAPQDAQHHLQHHPHPHYYQQPPPHYQPQYAQPHPSTSSPYPPPQQAYAQPQQQPPPYGPPQPQPLYAQPAYAPAAYSAPVPAPPYALGPILGALQRPAPAPAAPYAYAQQQAHQAEQQRQQEALALLQQRPGAAAPVLEGLAQRLRSAGGAEQYVAQLEQLQASMAAAGGQQQPPQQQQAPAARGYW